MVLCSSPLHFHHILLKFSFHIPCFSPFDINLLYHIFSSQLSPLPVARSHSGADLRRRLQVSSTYKRSFTYPSRAGVGHRQLPATPSSSTAKDLPFLLQHCQQLRRWNAPRGEQILSSSCPARPGPGLCLSAPGAALIGST